MPTTDDRWAWIHAERAALADDLTDLPEERWATPSLCEGLTVRDVVAHLTAGASYGFAAWIRNLVVARFSADRMVASTLRLHLGHSPADTLARFRAVATSRTAPNGELDAWLGEAVVHGEDVRRPLGLGHAYRPAAVERVARFFAARNYTVSSKTAVEGLRLEAVDGPFATGDGPAVSGTTLALVMAMAGRSSYLDDLEGSGVAVLRERLAAG